MTGAVEIPLTRGKVALVSSEDADWLNQVKWHAVHSGGHWYAVHNWHKAGKRIYMHRAIMCPPSGMVVDHINDNGLDNRRSNLRVCTQSLNIINGRYIGPSGYRGVHEMRGAKLNPWRAMVRVDGKRVHLGVFPTPEEAARAYDIAALEHHGEFARLNFPRPAPKEEPHD